MPLNGVKRAVNLTLRVPIPEEEVIEIEEIEEAAIDRKNLKN